MARIASKGKERTVFCPTSFATSAEVLQEEEDRLGTHFRDAERQSDEPLQYLGGNESALRKCRRGRAEVLPHNLRHLFALAYYRLEKDVVRLADILGHASIETTRIYTSTTDAECIRSLTRLNLLI